MFVGKAGPYLIEEAFRSSTLGQSPSLAHKQQTRLEQLTGYKHSSLLQKSVNYVRKKFYNIGTRCQCYKTFFLHHCQQGLISYRVCPWKPFLVRSQNLRARLEPTQLEHLSDASFLGKLLVLPANDILVWKVIAGYNYPSLFDLGISNEGKKF